MIARKVLQDPSVASSTPDQQISFLRSKNLTQEEIDISLARAGDGSTVSNIPPSQPSGQLDYGYRNQHGGRQLGYEYSPYQGGFWGMPPEYVVRSLLDERFGELIKYLDPHAVIGGIGSSWLPYPAA